MFVFSFSVIIFSVQIRNIREGWVAGWAKVRKDIVPTESSCSWVFWPSDVFFLWCWFGPPHLTVVAQVGLIFYPFSCSSYVLAHREYYMQLLHTIWEGIYSCRLNNYSTTQLRLFRGFPELWGRILYSFIFFGFMKHGALSGAVVRSTALQAGISRVLFLMGSLGFSLS